MDSKLGIAVCAAVITTLQYLLTSQVSRVEGAPSMFAVIFGEVPPVAVLLTILTRTGLVFGGVMLIVWACLSFSHWR